MQQSERGYGPPWPGRLCPLVQSPLILTTRWATKEPESGYQTVDTLSDNICAFSLVVVRIGKF